MSDENGASVTRRVDDELGIIEDAGFLGSDAPRLFSVCYRPNRPVVGGVVICPAVLSEYDHTYSIDVAFARALAARGFAVYRFHYRGTGHSDGEPEEMTFASMCEDAAAVAARLADEFGLPDPIIVGLRFSALVAAATAADRGAAPLVLWEPALDGRSYFREASRADKMFQINEGPRPDRDQSPFAEVLERDGVVDVLGYPACKALYDSAAERSLVESAGSDARPILIVRGGPPDSERAGLNRAVEELRGRGCAVDVEALEGPIVWWFQGPEMRRSARPQVAELLDRTVSWLQRQTDTGAVR